MRRSLKLLPISAPRARYPGFKPGKWTLKAGTVRRAGARPLPVDIDFERDVAMQLRDGITLYTDVFRPANDARVPTIFNWSPYGFGEIIIQSLAGNAYVVASYTNMAHTVGTFDAWRHLGSAQKWLRIHNTQEWTDYYTPEHVEDLRRFFDYFAKGLQNGSTATSVVRMAVLNPGGADIVNRVDTAFPPSRALKKMLFMHAGGFAPVPAPSEGSVAYAAEDGKTTFLHSFTEDAEISGYMAVRLWLEG